MDEPRFGSLPADSPAQELPHEHERSPNPKPGLFDVLKQVREVFSRAMKSGVAAAFGGIVLIQLALIVVTQVSKLFVTFSMFRGFAAGHVESLAIAPILFYGIMAIPWGLTFGLVLGLLRPMRETLRTPNAGERGFKWAFKQALGSGPMVFVLAVAGTVAASLGWLLTEYSEVALGIALLLAPVGLLAAAAFSPVLWYFASGEGLLGSLKRSVKLVIDNFLCFAGTYFALVVVALSCGCAGAVGYIVPFLGEGLMHAFAILFCVPAWFIYVSLINSVTSQTQT